MRASTTFAEMMLLNSREKYFFVSKMPQDGRSLFARFFFFFPNEWMDESHMTCRTAGIILSVTYHQIYDSIILTDLLDEAVSSREYPVLMNKSAATRVEESWFRLTGRPYLTVKTTICQRQILVKGLRVKGVISHLHRHLPGPRVRPGWFSVHNAGQNSGRDGWFAACAGPICMRTRNTILVHFLEQRWPAPASFSKHRAQAGVSFMPQRWRLAGLGRTSQTAWTMTLTRWGSACLISD